MNQQAPSLRGNLSKRSRGILLCMAGALLPVSAWAADDAWVPAHGHATFIRNNSLSGFTIQSISQVSATSGCSVAGADFQYTNQTANVPLGAADVIEVLNVDDVTNCLKSGDKWRFIVAKDGCTITHAFEVSGNGSLSVDSSPFYSTDMNVALDYCGTRVIANLFGRGSYHESGVYITLGADKFSDLGPTRDTSNAHKLTVTSYNTYLGTESKPEHCERAAKLAEALPSLNVDVLVLEEMNLRQADCFDGLELAAYLWTGDLTSTNNEHIENDSYARSLSGTGSSPNGDTKYSAANGAFPYISQFVSGIAVNGDENETGGVVILSKYPITMLENRTYNDRGTSEQKGFITVKVTKTAGGVSQDYYIVATHPSATASYREKQLAELATYLNTTFDFPSGARVIVAGDLNTQGKSGELASLGVDVQYTTDGVTERYGQQTLTQYFPYSRDNQVNFYHPPDSNSTIDWVLPVINRSWPYGVTAPSSFSWYVMPVRNTSFKFADLSDHLAVTGQFTY